MGVPQKQPVLGIRISTTSYEEVAAVCRDWIANRRREAGLQFAGHYICVTSVHGIMMAMFDSAFKAELNNADIATPDGMPVVWALRSFGCKHQRRVYGPDLMLAVCEQAAREGHRIYLYGGQPDTLLRLQQKLARRFPSIVIAGAYSPPFRRLTLEEDSQITRSILDSDADIVFVGISTPKQEQWMSSHVKTLPGLVMLGVGAAFDFHAGRVRQAPLWMRQSGLEWLFRLMMEPRRLWKRYLLITPLFLPLWLMQKLRLLEYGPDQAGVGVGGSRPNERL